MKTAKISFETYGTVQIFGNDTNKSNLTQKEIKGRLNSNNACYQSVQNLLSSCLLSKNVKIRIYKTTILPFVLCGCEIWSLTLREEHRLRKFEKRVLRIFGPKKDEGTGCWGKLHDGELHDLHPSSMVRWAGHVARMGERWHSNVILVGHSEG
jgi:hypothetical protein